MKLVFEVIVPDSYGNIDDMILSNVACCPGVISVALMEYDGTGGYDPDEQTRRAGPEFGQPIRTPTTSILDRFRP